MEENGSSNTAAIGAVMLFTYQLQFGQTVSSNWCRTIIVVDNGDRDLAIADEMTRLHAFP